MLIVATTPVLTHATARAAHIRRHGRWEDPQIDPPEDALTGSRGDVVVRDASRAAP